jgi:hypothetical protein
MVRAIVNATLWSGTFPRSTRSLTAYSIAFGLGRAKLIERYGADMRLPDLREEIAKCRRQGQMHDACMVRYVDLVVKP